MSLVLYDKFEMPKLIKVDEGKVSTTYARFVAEPFERGFGHTIGNALRRMLLTAIEAPAIVSFFMEGVPHEYMAVEGIIEDVTNIVLNLKGALLRRLPIEGMSYPHEHKVVTKLLEISQDDLGPKNQKVITLGDLVGHADFEVINPQLPIFTVTRPMMKRIEIKVAIGRGYVPSERHNTQNTHVDEIWIDTIFSPVRLVNYYVEDTRVGQDTDFDRLILEVHTDGRITPHEGVAFAAKLLTKHLTAFEEIDAHEISFEEASSSMDNDREVLMRKLTLGITEIELSVRSTNCLNGANIETIGELVVMPESDLLQFRNFGKKSLNEIKAKLTEMGLELGMDLTRFGITQENIKERITTYLEERKLGAV
jgi:DNA-directed RNA polymerase subunit alpha